ncbi:MAG: right-handed parallel beta-helix repeat-containing protein [Phycisphaeraceae bacterium]|nr:right-handed parallel beta-helix repeat-containing protein [Phycisphaeraceae bacterium]
MRTSGIFSFHASGPLRSLLIMGLIICLWASPLAARQLYVAPDGDDAHPGTEQQPWRTIKHAAAQVEPGDSVHVAPGIYAGPIRPARSGSAESPIRLVSTEPGKAEVSGARPIEGWERYRDQVWVATVEGTVDQVFVDGKRISEASYPTDSGDPYRRRVLRLDRNQAVITGKGLDQPEGHWVGARLWGLDEQRQWVAQYTQVVASEPGKLTVADGRGWWREGSGWAILVGTLTALDSPGEWAHQDGKLYLWMPDGREPTPERVEMVRQGFAFDLSGRSHIHIEGFRLRCASINFDQAAHCVADGLIAKYVSLERSLRGGFNRDRGINAQVEGLGIVLGGRHNIIRNSHIAYGDGDGISVYGEYNRVENCLIHDFNWSATDCAPINVTGVGHVITRNTIFNSARSIIVHRRLRQGEISHNRLFNAGLVCRDLGMTYTYQTDGQGTRIAYNIIHHNWAVRSGCVGIYLDDQTSRHVVHHNVVYQVNEAIALNPPDSKHNLIANNTLLAFANSISMSLRRPQDMTGTVIRNNIFRGGVTAEEHMPNVTIDTNLFRQVDPLFVDADAKDFRLREGSPAIDAGTPIPPWTFPITGKSPDLGAFPFGAAPWRAGCDLPAAERIELPTIDLRPFRDGSWHPLNVVNEP